MLKQILLYALAAVIIVFAGLAVRHFILPPSVAPGVGSQPFFAAAFTDLSGQPQSMAQWRGKILVVNFWATWCAPCREEMPELSALHKKYRDSDLLVLGIASDELDKIHDYSRENPVSYPLFAGDIDVMNISASLGNDKGVLPYTAIITADGKVAKTYFGRVNQALLEETLVPMLAR